MRIVSFGEAPAPNTPRRRMIPQGSSPVQDFGTSTKSAVRRRSVLTDSVAAVSSNQSRDRKGKQRQEDERHSGSDCTTSTSRASSFTGSDGGSLKENDHVDGDFVKDIAMDLVTSTSTGSLMHQAMVDATLYNKKPKRRKAGRRIPLHGK